MDPIKNRHYFPECEETEFYENGECKKCRCIKTNKYSQTEKGIIIKGKSVAKQRFIRRSKKIKNVASQLEADMVIIGINDETYKKDLEQIKILIQRFCDLDTSLYKSLDAINTEKCA